jgi:hypothetical protein
MGGAWLGSALLRGHHELEAYVVAVREHFLDAKTDLMMAADGNRYLGTSLTMAPQSAKSRVVSMRKLEPVGLRSA